MVFSNSNEALPLFFLRSAVFGHWAYICPLCFVFCFFIQDFKYTLHMPKPKVFVTRLIPAKGLDMIREFCDADVWPDELPPSHEEIIRRVRDVEGLVSLLTDKIDAR